MESRVNRPHGDESGWLPQALYACRIDAEHAVQHANCLTLGTGRTMRPYSNAHGVPPPLLPP